MIPKPYMPMLADTLGFTGTPSYMEERALLEQDMPTMLAEALRQAPVVDDEARSAVLTGWLTEGRYFYVWVRTFVTQRSESAEYFACIAWGLDQQFIRLLRYDHEGAYFALTRTGAALAHVLQELGVDSQW